MVYEQNITPLDDDNIILSIQRSQSVMCSQVQPHLMQFSNLNIQLFDVIFRPPKSKEIYYNEIRS